MPAEEDDKPKGSSNVAEPFRTILNDFFSNPFKDFGRSYTTQSRDRPTEEQPGDPDLPGNSGPTPEDSPYTDVNKADGSDGK